MTVALFASATAQARRISLTFVVRSLEPSLMQTASSTARTSTGTMGRTSADWRSGFAVRESKGVSDMGDQEWAVVALGAFMERVRRAIAAEYQQRALELWKR